MEDRKSLSNSLFNFCKEIRIQVYLSKKKSECTDVEFRKVKPVDYKLFQVADLVCTMELLSEKSENRSFSNSETESFCSIRIFKKNNLKPIQKRSCSTIFFDLWHIYLVAYISIKYFILLRIPEQIFR